MNENNGNQVSNNFGMTDKVKEELSNLAKQIKSGELNNDEFPFETIVVPKPVHVLPSGEYAKVFVPLPDAIKFVPFQTTDCPLVLNIVVPNPIHVVGETFVL